MYSEYGFFVLVKLSKLGVKKELLSKNFFDRKILTFFFRFDSCHTILWQASVAWHVLAWANIFRLLSMLNWYFYFIHLLLTNLPSSLKHSCRKHGKGKLEEILENLMAFLQFLIASYKASKIIRTNQSVRKEELIRNSRVNKTLRYCALIPSAHNNNNKKQIRKNIQKETKYCNGNTAGSVSWISTHWRVYWRTSWTEMLERKHHPKR